MTYKRVACLASAGVTAIRPDELEFPNTMTDIDYDTWMLRYQKVLIGFSVNGLS